MREVDRLTFTIPEAARALGVDPKVIRHLITKGLPCMTVGRRKLIVRARLYEWLDKHAASTFTMDTA